MAKWLKQSTAASVIAGPFVAETDGYTTKESHTTMNVLVFKNSASDTVTSQAVTHTASGYYNVELDSGSTDTLGRLRLGFNDSASYLPVWEEYMVLPANTYDSLVAGTDRIDAELAGSGIAASTFAANAIDAVAIAASAINACSLAAGAVSAPALAASAFGSAAQAATWADKVADHTLRREWGEAASSADGDTKAFRSLLGAVAKLVNKVDTTSGSVKIYEADDSTELGVQGITACDAASPIVTVDTT